MKTSSRFDLNSAPHWKVYTNFGSDIDLVADGGGPCRRVRINTGTAGTLAMADAEGTAMDAIPNNNDGDVHDVIASKILASGTVNITSITVYW